MLKLEPSEAEMVRVPLQRPRREENGIVRELDKLVRSSNENAANDLADYHVLRRGLGFSANECAALRDAADEMRQWRMHR
jgi:hypothetical protein